MNVPITLCNKHELPIYIYKNTYIHTYIHIHVYNLSVTKYFVSAGTVSMTTDGAGGGGGGGGGGAGLSIQVIA
jgi:hypothetical protein